jgi:hypothetical protein
MKTNKNKIIAGFFLITLIAICIVIFGGVSKTGAETETSAEIDYSQITAKVPELDSLHESIFLLWHDAYPNKNYALIKETLPQLDISVSNLRRADLPGILHGKQASWDKEITNMESSLEALHKAADEDNKESMIAEVESLHSSYEKLIGITRPKLPELESFHQELYKVYHYYMPGNNLERIRATIPLMKEKILLLKKAKLPLNFADRQDVFDLAVSKLETSLTELDGLAKTDNKEEIKSAVEKLHTDYQSVDAIFQ